MNTSIIRYRKSYCKFSTNSLLMLSANPLVMITKQQITIIYIEEISIKRYAKKIKSNQIPKKLWEDFGQFPGHDHKTAY